MPKITLTQYRQRVAAVLGLTNSGDEQTLIDAWVNEGAEQFVLRSQCQVRTATLDLTEGTADYTLPTGILATVELYNTLAGTGYQMHRVTEPELLRMRQATGSTPARYYTVSGSDLLQLYPTPGSGETLTVVYVPRPATLTTGSDSPDEIPYEYHPAVADYACWRGAMYDENQPSQFGLAFLRLFERAVAECRAGNRRKGGARLAPARVGKPRRVVSDPSQILW